MSLSHHGEFCGSADCIDRRETVHRSAAVLVEDFSASAERPGQGHSDAYQIVLPYRGAFQWTVGRATHLLDANTLLFVVAGEDYREQHPLRDRGHASLIFTPEAAVLDEICGGAPARSHAAFRATTGVVDNHARFDAQRLLHARGHDAQLRADELAIRLLQRAIGPASRDRGPRPGVIARAKEVLHALGFEPLSLERVARDVGVSPVYLTQTFTRFEGVPLYRYQMRLRLNQALLELPSRNSLTELALDLGFSSHSHFAAAFRAAFGMTPSQYRAEAGARILRQ